MTEHDDEGDVEHGDRVFDGPQHRRVDDVAGGADDEHVTEALVEDDLSGDPAVGASEDHRGGSLCDGEAGPVFDALTGVFRITGDEALVTLFECHPC